MDNEQNNIYAFVRQQEFLYRSGTTKISRYVDHSLSETVQTIYAYLNSKFITGSHDSLGRKKPFFNIVIAARNVWFRATTIQRKDITIREQDSKHVITAFLATQKLQEWMRKARFGVFLADWGLTLAGFGSAVSKWVRKDGKLIATVVPWNEIICDTIDFDSNPKIELFEYTSAQLRSIALKKGWDMNVVESVIASPTVRMTITQELQDVKPYFHKIYEVHGEFPVSYLTGKEKDKDVYCQQMHILSYTRANDNGSSVEKYHDFSLFKGKEETDPYRCDSLIKEDGRTLSIGAVEHLFDSQWIVNNSAKAIKDQLDLASKLIFQTSDPTFTGQNVLTAIETGQILNHKMNEPLTIVPNGSHDTQTLTEYMNQWKALGDEINGITGGIAGATPHSGTSWRLQSIQIAQAQQLFDLMRANKALAIEDMLREKILPYLKTQLNSNKQIVATLEANDIKKIDSMYVPQEAIKRFNKKVIDHVLKNGSRPSQDVNLNNEIQQVQNEQNGGGATRYFKPSDITSKTWKDIFSDFDWMEVDIALDANGSSEASDQAAILQTLNTMLQLVMNPGYGSNPQAQMIVQQILRQTGRFSPLQIASTPAPQPQPMQQQTQTPISPVASPPNMAGAMPK